MSKEKKPFLKKGSRQFLSNAQVRSHSTKPKLIQYSNQDFPQPTPLHSNPLNTHDDIHIPTTNKSSAPKPTNKPDRIFQRTNTNKDNRKQHNTPEIVQRKPVPIKTNIVKKQAASLEDYLDDQQVGTMQNNRQSSKSGYKRKIQNQKNTTPKHPSYSKKESLTAMLQQQEEEQEANNQFINNSSFRPITNPMRHQQRSSSPVPPKKVQKNVPQHPTFQLQEQEQFNFVSDNSDQQPERSSTQKENKRGNIERYNSHVKNKFFCNNKDNSKPQPVTQDKQKTLTLTDIPKSLKEQIVNQVISEQEQQLFHQLQKVKEKVEQANRAKHKFEEANKNLERDKKEFSKEMEVREAEFEEKMKGQLGKLNRQKKYMKEYQMSSKGDWKNKNQLQEVKKQLEDMKEEKRKNEKKLRLELDQTRKKYEEEVAKNKLLTEQIKILEFTKIAHTQQIREHNDHKQQKKNKIIPNTNHYHPPKPNRLSIILSDDFSLNRLPLEAFHYQQNQLYQYYTQIKHQQLILESEEEENNKIKRIYRSGKIEDESINKYIKEKFPFDYTITHHINGDVKQQLLNRKIVIYYSQRSNATEIKTKNRVITYFLNNGTVQMQSMEDFGKVEEIFNGERLRRILPDGKIIEQKMQY